MKKIIIIGSGISGLYLANLLQKNGNYDYKILEKRPMLNLLDGYGIQISVNGTKLLNKIGFKNVAVHEVYYPSNINFYKANNCELISKIDISRFNSHGNFYMTLKRSVLIEFLIKNIPKDKIIFNTNIESINHKNVLSVNTDNKTWYSDNLILSDGIFSDSKNMVFTNPDKVKFYNCIAIRGTLKNLNIRDISLYLGSKFHFVIYPINQDNEYNFIAIIRDQKSSKIENISEHKILENYKRYIYSKTSFKLIDKLKNISIYPIYVSTKFNIPNNKNIFLSGDALYAFPPSFAQGASQSLESSYEIYKNLEGKSKNYYKNRELRVKKIKFRSELNHFAFHLSNPISILARDLTIKYLSKNKNFLENYLGNVYNK